MNPNQREVEETYQQYKERRQEQNITSNSDRRQLLWDSKAKKTYVKSSHGKLGTNNGK